MDSDTIRALAKLSRLELTEAELDRAREQLEHLLGHFDALQQIPTDEVEASPYPRPISLRMRADEPGETLPPEEVLQNAPEQRAGQFLVPRIIEG